MTKYELYKFTERQYKKNHFKSILFMLYDKVKFYIKNHQTK